MKSSKSILLITLMCLVVNAYSQSNSVFIIIDEIAENVEQLTAEFSGQSNVLVTDGSSPDVLTQIAGSVEHLEIDELHIYTATKPGALVFSSIAVTPDNEDEWSEALKFWSRMATTKVVIHSEVVFTGEEGLLLKQRLEELSGLDFSTRN